MKKLFVIVFASTGLIANATTYYVAPKGGSDSNAGTNINYPWATWDKAISTANAGDTVYFRGGVYYAVQGSPASCTPPGDGHNGTRVKPIHYFNYPGETPILDGKNLTSNSTGIYFKSASNIHLKGLTVRNFQQKTDATFTPGFYLNACNNITIEQCVANNMSRGYWVMNCDTVYLLNCDAYNCCDSLGSGGYYGGAGDGFLVWDSPNYASDSIDYVLLRGCRAWHCSDDGFDLEIEGYVEADSCWAWNQGYLMGDGNGFKYGYKWNSSAMLSRKFVNCLSAYNKVNGFDENTRESQCITLNVFNCTAYHNGGISYCTYDACLSPKTNTYKNNVEYSNGRGMPQVTGRLVASYNSWQTPPGVTLTNADFISLDSTGISGARQNNGSLPKIDFLKLTGTSDLINAGVNVGLPYYGSAPDLGFSESNYGNVILVTGIAVTGAGGATTIATDNGTLQLTAVVTPSNATNKTVTWSVTNGTGQATINSSGLVTAVANGTVTAKATANDGSGVSGSLAITISNQVIAVTGITITGAGGATTITTDKGTLQLTAVVTPSNATNKTVAWTVTNGSGQATINSTGLVTAVANGTVTAKATANDGSGVSGSLAITISNQVIAVTGIMVTGAGGATEITTDNGTLQLTASVTPSNATNKTVTWSVTNGSGQATINSTGLVTAVANGTVTAKAVANDGSGVSGTLAITISGHVIPISGITVTSENDKNTLNSGELTLQLSTVISPENVTDKSITWSMVSGTGQATISTTGLVTALANGSVTAVAKANDGSGVSGSYSITIASFPVSESRVVYIDPTNQSDPSQNGTKDHPYGSWSRITWKSGNSYLQKRGTVANESKINITSGDVTLGSYGDGDQPVIHSNVNDFAIRAYDKSNIIIKDLHITAVNAISCIYIMGETSDNVNIEFCTLESAVNGTRIIDGKNVVLRYNTFVKCSEAIYCYAENSTIYYNVFRDNEVAVSAMASSGIAEIYNNVFFNNTLGISDTYTDLTLYNNIFYLVNSSDKAIYNQQLNQLISDNNIYYPEQEGFIQIGGKVYNSLNTYQRDLGLDLNSITDDPQFVDAFNQDYSVAPNSPAINAGKLLGLGQDFYGTQVPSGGLPDIGLVEFKNPSGSVTTSVSHLNDAGRDDFQVYPNPSQGIFNVYVKNNNSKGFRITIKDLSGKMVYENIFSSELDFLQEINISTMQKGIYIVAVEDNTRSMSQPIILK
jgi:uncharacterized protein YjdB